MRGEIEVSPRGQANRPLARADMSIFSASRSERHQRCRREMRSNKTERVCIPTPGTKHHEGVDMKVDNIEKLFVNELKDLYSAEKQITHALPKMAKAATTEELRTAFETHLRETHGQIKRLDRVFEILGKPGAGKNCQGMKGLLEEGSETMEETEKGGLRDAAMIGAAQRVEHYEIAAYGTARTMADLLGQKEIAQLLQETLDEEGNTDKKLTQIASRVNREAQRQAA